MIRRLFIFASAMSLLLCAAIIVLWLRSYWVLDGVSKTAWQRYQGITSQQGRVLYYDQTNASVFPHDAEELPPAWTYVSSRAPAPLDAGDETWLNRIGLYAEWRTTSPSGAMPFSEKPLFDTITQIIVPYWIIAIPLAILPAFWLLLDIRRRARAARLTRGRCVHCGYDLRGSTDRCPECGTPIPPTAGVNG